MHCTVYKLFVANKVYYVSNGSPDKMLGAGEAVNPEWRSAHIADSLLQPSSSFVSVAVDGSKFTSLSLCISEELSLLHNTDTKAALLPPPRLTPQNHDSVRHLPVLRKKSCILVTCISTVERYFGGNHAGDLIILYSLYKCLTHFMISSCLPRTPCLTNPGLTCSYMYFNISIF